MKKNVKKVRNIRNRIRQAAIRADKRFLRAWKMGILRIAKAQRPIRQLQPITRPILKYSYAHARISSGIFAVLVLFTAAIPMLQQVYLSHRYQLDSQSAALVGKASMNLAHKLTYDSQKQVYQFNKDGFDKAQKSKDPTNPVAKLMAAQVGGEEGKDTKQLYSLDLSANLSKGVTVYDNNLGLSFTMLPQFDSATGRIVDGHLVYPIGGGQAVYSLKGNGLKEDVLLDKAPKDGRLKLSYTLKLPQELAAKPLGDGGIGIFSAEPALYGDISFGDAATQFKVMQSRKVSPKTNLVFTLPAPFIKQTDQKAARTGDVGFVLHGDQLSLQASGLQDLSYPISIDPSTIINSSNELCAASNESGVDINATSTSCTQVKRGGLTGGSIGAWSAGTSFTTARTDAAMVAYNGYLYILGGKNGTLTNNHFSDVQFAAIGSSGVLGSWGTTTSMTSALSGHAAVAYNGYIYVTGGEYGDDGGGNTITASMLYGKVDPANGTIISWGSSTALPTAREYHSMVAYNGYLYIMGGNHNTFSDTSCNGVASTLCSDVRYAPLNGNGTVGTWAATTSFPTTRHSGAAAVYNGYLYALGGTVGATTADTSVLYAPINADGTIGSWTATTSMATGKRLFTAYVNDGYLYAAGGIDASSVNSATVHFAQINANGTVGAWTATTSYTTGRGGVTGAAYNGYLYLGGGVQATSGACAAGVTYCNDTQYTKIDLAGVTGTYTANGTSVTAVRRYAATVAYNGYIYVMGGESAITPTCNTTTYYAPINANGSIGAWTTATNTFTTARCGAGAAAYNGYLYIFGGRSASATFVNTNYVSLIGAAGAPGAWSATGATTGVYSARWRHNAVIYNGTAYIIGGMTAAATGWLSDVVYAPVTSSGTITAAWTSLTGATSGLTARAGARAVLNGNILYVIGGETAASTQTTSIQYSTIASSGAPSNFSSTTTTFTTARSDFGAVVYNGYLYVMGGINGASTYQSDVQMVPIANTGDITGTWTTIQAITTARMGFGAFAYNGYMYIVGGYHSTSDTACNGAASNYCSDVKYAQINNGGPGTLGSYTTLTASTARAYHASVAYNGYLYIIGGCSASSAIVHCSTELSDVSYAPITAGGTIGSWAAGTSLPAVREYTAAVAYNGNLYVIGGEHTASDTTCSATASQYCDTVLYAPLSSNGAVGTWTATTALSSPRGELAVFTYGGYLYVAGGVNGSGSTIATVEAALINSSGTIGSWTATTSLPSANAQLAAFAYNGYVYALGGGTNVVGGVATAYFAQITGAGTIGSWTATTNLPSARRLVSAVAYNGYLYVIGGVNGSSTAYLSDANMAAINSNGTIGSWTTTTAMAGNRGGMGTAISNGYLYLTGGCQTVNASFDCNSGAYQSDTRSVALNSIPRTGMYSKLIDVGSAVTLSSIAYTGTVPDGSGSITYKAWASDGTTSAGSGLISSITGSGGGSSCTGSGTTARYVWVRATLDDSRAGGAFPDVNGTNTADLQSITVNYATSSAHPPPIQRLHGGKVLQAGGSNNLKLDTCGV